MSPIVFTKIDGGKIKISKKALIHMKKFIQDNNYKKEAGGVLLGRYICNSLDIVIDEITIPMWGDRRKWFSFFRSRRPHQKVIDRLWQESEGTINYLGEWHTHPENTPAPSDTDIKGWEYKLRQDVFDGDSLWFIIIGIKSLRIWEVSRNTLHYQLIGESYYSEVKNV
jgi:integrative and conjugative element protein (TIGR02256 family)